MSEDILHRKQLETSEMTFDCTSEIYNDTLVIIEDIIWRNRHSVTDIKKQTTYFYIYRFLYI